MHKRDHIVERVTKDVGQTQWFTSMNGLHNLEMAERPQVYQNGVIDYIISLFKMCFPKKIIFHKGDIHFSVLLLQRMYFRGIRKYRCKNLINLGG